MSQIRSKKNNVFSPVVYEEINITQFDEDELLCVECTNKERHFKDGSESPVVLGLFSRKLENYSENNSDELNCVYTDCKQWITPMRSLPSTQDCSAVSVPKLESDSKVYKVCTVRMTSRSMKETDGKFDR